MAQWILKFVFIVAALLTSVAAPASPFSSSSAPKFVTAEQAFDFYAQQNDGELELSWQVRKGYYLYRHQFSAEGQNVRIGKYTVPNGRPYQDEFFGNVEALTGFVTFSVPLLQVNADATVKVTYQGCAEDGFCYPPETKVIKVMPVLSDAAGGSSDVLSDAHSEGSATANQVERATDSDVALPFSPWLALLFGLGIAFTPCVLPMYPLISGVILGQRQRPSTKRIVALSFAYVQGMAITYTLLGMVVAAAGLKFQAAFQHPYLLIAIAIIFVLLALSMFGAYSLQLPSGLQTWLSGVSGRQRGGSLIGVFIMGAIAGVICSPCTTAPLSAILLYIAQSGNMLFGGGVLYLYALGMGIPLIVVTVFGNRLLPRAGEWMQHVKALFGFVILALPVFLLERVVAQEWGVRMWSALATSLFIWAFITLSHYGSGRLRFLQILLLGLAIVSAKPLQDWAFQDTALVHADSSRQLFKPVDSIESFNTAVSEASGKVVMVDFYADWCVACKEFEKYTFSDPRVKAALKDSVLLQADVTANSERHGKMFNELNIIGLPTILFFDAQGREIRSMRVTGFMNADGFLTHLAKLPTQAQ